MKDLLLQAHLRWLFPTRLQTDFALIDSLRGHLREEVSGMLPAIVTRFLFLIGKTIGVRTG
jgi:hypothetical protein